MTVQLEHPIWSEDQYPISNCRLIENPGFSPPDAIAIRWTSAGEERDHIIRGNEADDFMERYRSAPDPEAKQHLMIAEIMKAT